MKKIIKQLIFLGILISLIIVAILIKNNESASDFYMHHIAQYYYLVMGNITSFIPFSLYEFFLIFLVIVAIILIVKIIKNLIKRDYITSLSKFIKIVNIAAFCIMFYSFVGSINYSRSNIDIPLYEGEVDQTLIDDTINYYLNDYNLIASSLQRDDDGRVKIPYSFDELNSKIQNEFNKIDSNYLFKYTPNVSKLTFSFIFTELHITGVTFLITGQSSINAEISDAEKPFVMAHEIAHMKGVGREDDANLVALYVTLNSEDPYIRYSAYQYSFLSLLDIYRLTNYSLYRTTYSNLNPLIIKEYQLSNDFWYKEHTLLQDIGNFFNNLFLKINGNQNGTGDYIDDSIHTSTGEEDEEGNEIFEIKYYSPYQKLYFQFFLTK